MLFFAALLLVLPLVPRANEYPLARFFVVNDVLSRPFLTKFPHTYSCIVEGTHGLNEVQVSITLHPVDAKRTQPNSDWGQPARLLVAVSHTVAHPLEKGVQHEPATE